MSFSLIAHTGASSNGVIGAFVNTSAIDTTGANLIVVHFSRITGGNVGIFDSKSNSWTTLTGHSATTVESHLAYTVNPTVGSGHIFSVGTNANNYPSVCVAAFSGAGTSPFDQQNGTANDGPSGSQQIGSITPTLNNELIVAGLAFYANIGSFSSITIDSGMTITDTAPYINANAFGSSLAYGIQNSLAAINPTWSWTGSGNERGVGIASFKVGGSSVVFTAI